MREEDEWHQVPSFANSWQIDGETLEITDFIFLDSKVTVDGDYSHEMKKRLDPWKKNYDQNRQGIKRRDITLLTKVCLVEAMVFPVVMYGCESWTIKKTDC